MSAARAKANIRVASTRDSRRARQAVCEFAELETPIGNIRVIERAGSVLCVDLFPVSIEIKRAELERKLKFQVELVPRKASVSAREIREYFAGRRRSFDVPVDLSLTRGFQREVLSALQQVSFGQLVSYGYLARRAGSPLAFRAVGAAMRQNPIPIIVPCHRVTASDGTLGGFSAGLDTKRRLLELEGVAPLKGGWTPRRGVR